MPKRATSRTRAANRRVAILAYDDLCTFEFGIAVDIFALDRPEMGADWYTSKCVAAAPGPMRALGGIRIVADGGLELLEDTGTIVAPGWNGDPTAPLLDALVRAHARGARLMSLCSGSFLFAAAGLLDGRRATTHWRRADEFIAKFPQVEFVHDVLYVDEGSVLTSAGSAAGIDLCLHIVRQDFGAAAANTVARRMVVAAHREGGQRQFIERPVPRDHEAGRLSRLLEELRERIDEPAPIAKLARRAGMSERTFIRRFKEATGMAPGQWLAAERVARARDLLESTDAPLEEIAVVAGFGSAAGLRHHFRKQMSVSPSSYRRRFGVV